MSYINQNPTKRHCLNHAGKSKFTRIKTYPIEPIFDFIRNNPLDINIRKGDYNKQSSAFYIDEDGNKCKLRRARIFFEMGVDCAKCGLEAKFFALEKWADGSYHLDLYGVDDAGDDVLMTIDHVHAKSKGGPDHLDNYAPLCKCCNELKSNF